MHSVAEKNRVAECRKDGRGHVSLKQIIENFARVSRHGVHTLFSFCWRTSISSPFKAAVGIISARRNCAVGSGAVEHGFEERAEA